MIRVTLIVLAIAAMTMTQAGSAGVTLGVLQSGTGGGTAINPCASLGNTLDYSDTTGCNLVQMMTGRP